MLSYKSRCKNEGKVIQHEVLQYPLIRDGQNAAEIEEAAEGAGGITIPDRMFVFRIAIYI